MIKKLTIFLATIFLGISVVHGATGTIDPAVTNQVKVCHDVTCTLPTPGIINFELTAQPSIVIDSVTGLSGKVWGNELGWITLNPTGAGVTFANAASGVLTGKAWSQVGGWINFAPTGQSVVISPNSGEFNGWAWVGGPYGGWIKFDCFNAATCVRTTWRPSTGGSGGGGGGHPIDVCPNIPENQTSIPSGYTVDSQGNCILSPVDRCINLPGNQETVPAGYAQSNGACFPAEVDYCPNISGRQSFVPRGYSVDENGNCVVAPKEPTDYCPNMVGVQISPNDCALVDVCINLPGTQITVPMGYNETEHICMPELFDACPNMSGVQNTIPAGYGINEAGACVKLAADLCSNLAGNQAEVPKGFTRNGDLCLYQDTLKNSDEEIRVIAFPFVPKFVQLPSDNPLIKKVLEKSDKVFGSTLTATPYKVDLVSSAISIFILIIIILFLIRLIRILAPRF